MVPPPGVGKSWHQLAQITVQQLGGACAKKHSPPPRPAAEAEMSAPCGYKKLVPDPDPFGFKSRFIAKLCFCNLMCKMAPWCRCRWPLCNT